MEAIAHLIPEDERDQGLCNAAIGNTSRNQLKTNGEIRRLVRPMESSPCLRRERAHECPPSSLFGNFVTYLESHIFNSCGCCQNVAKGVDGKTDCLRS
jgi:hypothetical protein